MVFKKVLINRFTLVLLMLTVCLALFSVSNKVHAISSTYFQAYQNMATRLPDDSYNLRKTVGGPAVPNSDVCANDPQHPGKTNGVWGCRDSGDYTNYGNDNRGHQYITLSNNSVNNNNDGGLNIYNKTVKLAIYTTDSLLGPKDISLFTVNRGISDSLACYNKMTATFYRGDDSTTQVGTPRAIGNGGGCGSHPITGQFPQSAFTEIENTGIFRGYIVISFNNDDDPEPGNQGGSQSSFTITASGARLGYVPPSPTLSAETCPNGYNANCVGWVSTYPTNFSSVNKVRYYFRPPCNLANGSPFTVSWQDVNQGDPNIQPTGSGDPQIRAVVYKYRPDNISNTMQQVRTYNSLSNPATPFATEQRTEYSSTDTDGTQFAFMVEFENVRGGNGINFKYPFPSADARIPCTPPCQPGGCPTGAPGTIEATCTSVRYRIPPGQHRVRIYVNESNSAGYPSNGNNGAPIASDYRGNNWDYNDVINGGSSGYEGVYDLMTARKFAFNGKALNVTFQVLTGTSDGNGTQNPPMSLTDVPNNGIMQVRNDCFRATCTIDPTSYTNVDDAPANSGAVKAGQGLSAIRVYITNVGANIITPTFLPQRNNSDGTVTPAATIGASLAGPTGAAEGVVGVSAIGVGQTALVQFPNRTPPGGRTAGTLTALPIFQNLGVLGPQCEAPLNTYEYFSYSLSGFANPDNLEDPNYIDYGFGIDQTQGPIAITQNIISRLDKQVGSNPRTPLSGTPLTETQTIQDVSNYRANPNPSRYDNIREPREFTASDQACYLIDINRDRGWVGPGGSNDVYAVDDPATTGCRRIVDRPYVRTYGSDVSVGGTFQGNCTVSNIQTYTRPVADFTASPIARSGSGVQFAALAMGNISGFSSASTRGADLAPRAPSGLTFANTASGSGSDPNRPLFGGQLSSCAPPLDYYRDRQLPVGSPDLETVGPTDPNIFRNGKQTKVTGNPTIGNITLGNDVRGSVIVDGDVYINGNIQYANDSWSDLNQIPSFALIVRGNIFIDPSVTRLDGLFVAQDNAGVGGNVLTCAPGGADLRGNSNRAAVYNSCRTQLIVNGSMVAKKVYLMRVANTLNDSTGRETPQGAAAEVFNFTPEILLSEFMLRPKGDASTGEYDYITTLPPTL